MSGADQNSRRLSGFQGFKMEISIHGELVVCTPESARWQHGGIVPAEASDKPSSVPWPAAAPLDSPIDVQGMERHQGQAYLGSNESCQRLERHPLTQPRALHIGRSNSV